MYIDLRDEQSIGTATTEGEATPETAGACNGACRVCGAGCAYNEPYHPGPHLCVDHK